ncbi:MAG: hypothetical protein PHW03_05950 [Eubacteriales bacterium]|nr:hypothetical protein [Eubacteriales bacterium]
MLIYIDNNKTVTPRNRMISKEDAQPYISDTCIWIDGDFPEAPKREGYNVVYKLKGANEVVYEYAPIDPLPESERVMSELLASTECNTCLLELMNI